MAQPTLAERLTLEQKKFILGLRRDGLAVKDIRKALQEKYAIKTSDTGVYTFIRGIDPVLAARRPIPPGFAKKLTPEQKELLVMLRAEYGIEQQALAVMVKTMFGGACSPPILSNFFRDCGLGRRVDRSRAGMETLELVKCPYCGKLHKMWLHRARDGNTGMMYKYHQECLEAVRRIEDGEEDYYGATHRNA